MSCKILYATGQLARHGGIERVTALKVNSLVERGYDVYLSAYEQDGRPFVYPISEKVKYIELPINYNVDFGKESLYSMRQLNKVPRHIAATQRLIKDIKPVIIIVPNFGYEFWFMPLIKGKAKIIREYHSSQYGKPLVRWTNKRIITKKIDDWAQRQYDKVVVLTPQEKDYFNYKKNIEVIPNPIEPSRNKTTQQQKRVITVGRISPVKGFERFIEMAKIIHSDYPDWTFDIYGDGYDDYDAKLKHQIKESMLEGVVIMHGRTDNASLEYEKASIYVCTSKTESFGLTLVEAEDCGLPVVSFDCPNGPRNIIRDGVDGFLVEEGNVEMLSQRVMELINNNDLRLRMSVNAVENAKRFHPEQVMDVWCNMFEQLRTK